MPVLPLKIAGYPPKVVNIFLLKTLLREYMQKSYPHFIDIGEKGRQYAPFFALFF